MSKVSNIRNQLSTDNGNGGKPPQPIPLSQIKGKFHLEILGGTFTNDGNIGRISLTLGFLDPKLKGSKIDLQIAQLKFQQSNIIIPGRG